MSLRIMVTGGAGFIGSNLCKRLLEECETEVFCVDNLYTGNLRNVESMLKNNRFHFLQHDITRPLDIQVGQIYNAACPASPPAYQRDPIFTLRTNVIGTMNMLELANKCNAAIMQFSTSEVYGDALVSPQNEQYWGNVNPDGVRSCYDEGKRAAEALCFDYNRVSSTKIRVIRIFNTYGPQMDPNDGRVISNFINQALRNEPLTVYGNGSQTRSFCYVDDLINGIILMMNNRSNFLGPVNLGNPNEISMLKLASMVIQQTGSRSELRYCALPKDDPRQRRPDIDKATSVLGWKPEIDLSSGLEQTIRYYSSLAKATR